MTPLATLKTSRVLIAPNSRAAPPVEGTGHSHKGRARRALNFASEVVGGAALITLALWPYWPVWMAV